MITTLREGKAKLSALVNYAANGEEVVITVRGQPMARLCPMSPIPLKKKRDPATWNTILREARATYSVGSHSTASEILDELRGDRT